MASRRFFGSAEKRAQPRRAVRQSLPVGADGLRQRADHLHVVSTDRPLLSARRVGLRLGVSAWTVYRLTKHQQLPFLLIGGVYRFDQDELDRWLDERRQRHTDLTDRCVVQTGLV